MQWEGRRQSENIEDRRPVPVEIDDPYFGKIIGKREAFTENLTEMIPETLNTECQAKVLKAWDYMDVSTAAVNNLTPDEQAQKLGYENAAAVKNPMDVSFQEEVFNPRSCPARISNFFKMAAENGLGVGFEEATPDVTAPAAGVAQTQDQPLFTARMKATQSSFSAF